MAKQGKVGSAKSDIVARMPRACSDELAAVEMLEELRWGNKPICPRCDSESVRKMLGRDGTRSARFLWRCHGCKKQFTVKVGTVMEDSKIKATAWAYAFWAACSSKKGVSALQIKRMTGLSYESALFMMHRIRCAMAEDLDNAPKLSGTVEVDETYVGGRNHYRGDGRKQWHKRKAAVMVLIERGGRARAFPIEWVNSYTLQKSVLKHVHVTSSLMTDEHSAYPAVGQRFHGGHHTVNHSAREYVRGKAYTNTAESFFSLFKRGLHGTFHAVSKHHLHRYASEFAFRWNTRKVDDGERVRRAVLGAEGKRLLYKEPVRRLA